MEIGFPEALLVLGVVLAAAAGLSGWARGTVLSITVLAVAAGVALAGLDVLVVEPGAEIVIAVVELALVLTLFTDGLVVERELLRREWRAPVRALVIAMPVTLVLLGLAAKVLFPDLSWAEAFLVGAILAPTDPVVTSTLVAAKHVPRRIRHTLNLESGLNDGLALPVVLFLIVLVAGSDGASGEALALAGESVTGALIGLAVGIGAGIMLGRLPGGGLTRRYEGVYALGVALATFGVAEVTYGNGLISAFVAGIAVTLVRQDVPDAFAEFNESVSATFQVITFVIFGALIVATGWPGGLWPLLAFAAFALLAARPAAVLLAFVGVALPLRQKLFIAWFGPKGVASVLFALFVLNSAAPGRTILFDIAAFTVLASVLAHGLTDTVGAKWISEHIEPDDADG